MIVIVFQKFFRNKKIVRINHFPIIFSDKINIKINIYIYFLESRILEARVRTMACETYVWQFHTQLCDLLCSPVRINPHVCVRHAPHHADTLFSGWLRSYPAEANQALWSVDIIAGRILFGHTLYLTIKIFYTIKEYNI